MNTRNKLLTTTRILITKRMYSHLTRDRIASHARVAQGCIGYYFGTVAKLINEASRKL